MFGHAEIDFTDLLVEFKKDHQIKLLSYGSNEEIVGLLYLQLELSPDIKFGNVPESLAS